VKSVNVKRPAVVRVIHYKMDSVLNRQLTPLVKHRISFGTAIAVASIGSGVTVLADVIPALRKRIRSAYSNARGPSDQRARCYLGESLGIPDTEHCRSLTNLLAVGAGSSTNNLA